MANQLAIPTGVFRAAMAFVGVARMLGFDISVKPAQTLQPVMGTACYQVVVRKLDEALGQPSIIAAAPAKSATDVDTQQRIADLAIELERAQRVIDIYMRSGVFITTRSMAVVEREIEKGWLVDHLETRIAVLQDEGVKFVGGRQGVRTSQHQVVALDRAEGRSS